MDYLSDQRDSATKHLQVLQQSPTDKTEQIQSTEKYIATVSDEISLLEQIGKRVDRETPKAELARAQEELGKLKPNDPKRADLAVKINELKAEIEAGENGKIEPKANVSISLLQADGPEAPDQVRVFMAIYAKSDNDGHKDVREVGGQIESNNSTLWVGVGTPHRALNYLQKYCLDAADTPVIRSFLVDKTLLSGQRLFKSCSLTAVDWLSGIVEALGFSAAN